MTLYLIYMLHILVWDRARWLWCNLKSSVIQKFAWNDQKKSKRNLSWGTGVMVEIQTYTLADKSVAELTYTLRETFVLSIWKVSVSV
jgi:hypothetical protein